MATLRSQLLAFDQRPFNGPRHAPAGLADWGLLFAPDECRRDGTPGRTGCKLIVFLHGCSFPRPQSVHEAVALHGGFNEWAARNRLVVLYPQMGRTGRSLHEKLACWDSYGTYGDYGAMGAAAYDARDGPQMRALHDMVSAIAGIHLKTGHGRKDPHGHELVEQVEEL